MISIGIDVDGVLCDFNGKVKELAKHRFNLEYNANSWDEMFELVYNGRTLGSYVFNDWAEEIFTSAPPIAGSVEAFEHFVANKQIIPYIVTARNGIAENFTEQWLINNGFTGYKNLLFLRDKTKAPCTVLIDDKPSNIEKYVRNAKMGILIDAPYNKPASVPHRVSNLIEAYQLINRYL